MKSLLYIFLACAMLISCGQSNDTMNPRDHPGFENPEENQEAKEQSDEDYIKLTEAEPEKETVEELAWNYSGHIGKYPIKAQINYGEAWHAEGSGAVRFPVSGYYFYDTQNKKIPLNGEASGVGMIYLTATVGSSTESFDGEMSGDAALEDFSGTWSNGKKSLDFELKAYH